jgi:hypothetical protein
LFVRGEHGVDQFKEAYNPREGAIELVNLSFKHINWAEKFCRIVSNGISDDNWMLDIRATDRNATLKKEAKRDHYLKYIANKPLLEMLKQKGIDMMPAGDMPQDPQEIDLRLELNERPKIEIAEEILIDYVLKSNNWERVKRQWEKDITDVGLMIARGTLTLTMALKCHM